MQFVLLADGNADFRFRFLSLRKQIQKKVLIRLDFLSVVFQHQIIAINGCLEVVRRRFRVVPFGTILDVHSNRKILGDVVGVFHREEVLYRPVEFLKILGVAQKDSFFLPTFEREDSHLEHVAFHHFQ